MSYFDYRNYVDMHCPRNSLILFVNHPLTPTALVKLNTYHQLWNIWLIYSIEDNTLEIYTLYYRIYDLLERNDFDGTNKIYLTKNDRAIQALGLI